MVAMPYIVVNAVLSLISLILLALTGAALLSKYSWANGYLPARWRGRRLVAFLAHGLVLSLLLIVLVSYARDTSVPRPYSSLHGER